MTQIADIDGCAHRQPGIFLVNSCRVGEVETRESHLPGQTADDLCIRQRFAGRVHYLIQVADPSLGIGHRAFLFRPTRCRQHQVGVGQCLRLVTDLLHHDELCFFKGSLCLSHIRQAYQRVGADDPDGLQPALLQCFEYLGCRKPRFR